MKLNYKLKKNDFLQYTLYEYSQNNFKKLKNKFVVIYAGIFLVAGIISILSHNHFVAFYFLIITIGIVFIVPSRLKDSFFHDSLKKSNDIDTDKDYSVTLNEDSIELSTDDFYTKININLLKKIVEVKIGFYLILQTQILIIPKSEEVNIIDVKNELLVYSKKINIKYEDSINWKY